MNQRPSSTMVSVTTLLLLLASSTLLSSGAAFTAVPCRARIIEQQQRRSFSFTTATTVVRHAIIYGWDGEEDETSTTTSSKTSDDILNDSYAGGIGACDPDGIAVAERLSQNLGNQMGSLARLAVAFSPPERSLTLQDIEQVHIICVSATHIDIEAVICEDHGCVSLAVPVSFPAGCSSHELEGCVLSNLDVLDEQAELLLSSVRMVEKNSYNTDSKSLDELCEMSSSSSSSSSISSSSSSSAALEYPDWWVSPECSGNTELAMECDSIRNLLNEAEFANEIKVLAQTRLVDQEYHVQQAVVAAVGPAGLCLKVRATVFNAQTNLTETHVLDVMVPFVSNSHEPVQSVQELRAKVLGTVAAPQE